jgi:hypothetical protein
MLAMVILKRSAGTFRSAFSLNGADLNRLILIKDLRIGRLNRHRMSEYSSAVTMI